MHVNAAEERNDVLQQPDLFDIVLEPRTPHGLREHGPVDQRIEHASECWQHGADRERQPVQRCPVCGDVRYSWGPAGPPQRRCWAFGHLWDGTAPADPVDAPAAVLEDPVVRAAIERLDGRVVRVRRR